MSTPRSIVSADEALRRLQDFHRGREAELAVMLDKLAKLKKASLDSNTAIAMAIEKSLRNDRNDMHQDMRAYLDILIEVRASRELYDNLLRAAINAKAVNAELGEGVELSPVKKAAPAVPNPTVTADPVVPVTVTVSPSPTVPSDIEMQDMRRSRSDSVDTTTSATTTESAAAPAPVSSPAEPQHVEMPTMQEDDDVDVSDEVEMQSMQQKAPYQRVITADDFSLDEREERYHLFLLQVMHMVDEIKKGGAQGPVVLLLKINSNFDILEHSVSSDANLVANLQQQQPARTENVFGSRLSLFGSQMNFFPPQRSTGPSPQPTPAPEHTQEQAPSTPNRKSG